MIRNFWETLANHWDDVCPTCPICCGSGSLSIPQTQHPCAEGQTGHLPHLARHWCVQEVFETLPDSCVMLNSKIEAQRGVHNSKQVVGTRRCTIKQQDPCALQIWDLPDSLQEGSVFTNLLGELCLDEVRVPKRGAQDSYALPVRGQIVVTPPCVIRLTICVEEVFAVGWTRL